MKIRLILLVLLLIAVICSLKTFGQSKVRFEYRLGLNFSNWVGNNAPTNQSLKAGFIAGIAVNYPLTDRFDIVPEILFTMKGTKAPRDTINYKESLNYIEVPVLLRFNFLLSESSSFIPNIYAGPAFDYNVSATEEATSANYEQITDFKNNVKKFDLSFVLGGGLEILFAKMPLCISARYTFSIISFDNFSSNLNLRNNVFSIIIGTTF
jgi:hypothetical protein